MNKRTLRLLAAALATTASLVAAPRPAAARIFPGTAYGMCVGGTYEVVHFGWFGQVSAVEFYAC